MQGGYAVLTPCRTQPFRCGAFTDEADLGTYADEAAPAAVGAQRFSDEPTRRCAAGSIGLFESLRDCPRQQRLFHPPPGGLEGEEQILTAGAAQPICRS